MAEPFIGELRIVSFNFAPRGWAQCDGQLLPINQNQALFSLLGTTFGGDGRVNFALPDLRGRVPIHVGAGHTLGERAGEQAHTLTLAELPLHTHTIPVSPLPAQLGDPTGAVFAASLGEAQFAAAASGAMAPGMVSSVGGSQAHLNMQPFLTLTVVIALQGIFPSQN